MLTSATKQKQWLRVGLVWVAGPGHVTSKRTKHATNFRFNLLHVKDVIEFRGYLKAGDDLEFLPPGKIGGV